MVNPQEIEKVATGFNASRLDRQGVAVSLRRLVASCTRECAKCSVPQVVKNRFSESVQIYLKGQISCLRSQ